MTTTTRVETTTTTATMATTTDSRRAAAWRPGRRFVALALALTVLIVATWAIVTFTRDDDVPVDPATPEAQRAVTVAREIVSGRVVAVARDRDDGTWEITIAQGGRDYEVELAPGSLNLLGLDYD
jgi:uncharacterized membrane protein YkoI